MALLVCVGVDEEGFREVPAVEVQARRRGGLTPRPPARAIDREPKECAW